MNLVSLNILKFSIVLLIIVNSVFSYFRYLTFSASISIVIVLAITYFFIGYKTLITKRNRIKGENYKTNYLPFIIISKRIIIIFFFIVLMAFFLVPETQVLWLIPPISVLCLGEILFFIFSIKANSFSILIFSDYIFMMQDKEEKVFANEIRHIEFRYDNFYMVLLNGKTIMINPDFMPAPNKISFKKEFLSWASTNNLVFTQEAKLKLGSAIIK